MGETRSSAASGSHPRERAFHEEAGTEESGMKRSLKPRVVGTRLMRLLCLSLALVLGATLVACGAQNKPASSDTSSSGASSSSTADATSAGFTQKEVPVFREKLTDEKLALRFYEKTPNVAYISLKDYYKLMLPQGSMDVERKDDGTFLYTSHTGADPSTNTGQGQGGTAVVDPAKGTLTSPDMPAFTNMMIYIGKDAENMKSVTYWLLGSMVSARWPKLLLPGVCMVIGVLFFLTQMRNLNTLLVGEEAAITLGVDLTRWRRIYMVVTSLLSAVAVCTCGIVGFVGLMIPHIVRGFAGSDHRFLLPLASLSGGIFLIWADVLARIVLKNTEIPLGVITSAIGAPIFVYMMVKKSYGFGGGER